MNISQTTITVRSTWAFVAVLTVSLAIPLAFSCQVSALLPVSDIPIVGQPVADTVNTVTDDVVSPVVDTVADVLPEPVGDAVQAPVEAVTQTVAPIVGPSSPDNAPHQIVSRVIPNPDALPSPLPLPMAAPVKPADTTNLKNPKIVVAASQTSVRTAASGQGEQSWPFMNSVVASLLSGNLPMTITTSAKNIITTARDISRFVSAAAILLIMAGLLTKFIATIAKVNSRSKSANEMALVRHDLALTSVVTLTLLLFGAVSIFVLLFSSVFWT